MNDHTTNPPRATNGNTHSVNFPVAKIAYLDPPCDAHADGRVIMAAILDAHVVTPTVPEKRVKWLSLAELRRQPPKQWLIDGIFGAGDLGMVYGAPGTGKTFVVIDLAISAALGAKFANRFDVERRLNVAYCAGEGLGGISQRFESACEYHGISDDDLPNFYFWGEAPQLSSKVGAGVSLAELAAEWDGAPLDLLIVDTLHSATIGTDENSAQDMGRVLEGIKAAQKILGCTVLLVHHTNKAGTGERGSSALRGAMDFMLEVRQNGSGSIMSCEKLKDGATWSQQPFSLVEKAESVRVFWHEPTDETEPSARDTDIDAFLTEMRRYAGKHFEVRSLAEIIAKTDAYARRLLSSMVENGTCLRTLRDADKAPSNRNPWVYFVPESSNTFQIPVFEK